jgi:parallel beta-helix repeat protein
MVSPGRYVEYGISHNGKAITVMSTDPTDSAVVASTIVDANSQGRVFRFQSREDSTSVLTGLTITGGLHAYGGGINCYKRSHPTITRNIIVGNSSFVGGGIRCYYSSPIIKNNLIKDNYVEWGGHGAGISCYFSSPVIENNRIIRNTTDHLADGGGIWCGNSSPTITNNIIRNNVAGYSGGFGGGIHCQANSNPVISNNTITENLQGGVYIANNSSPTITNTIIWGNAPYEVDAQNPVITYCDIRDGWDGEGNINEDPLFVDPNNGNFNVCEQSPCIDSGDPGIQDPDSTRSDIGVYFPDHSNCDFGNIWYISASAGNDSTGDGSSDNPFKTIQHGIDLSVSGDTILVAKGIYEENILLVSKSILLTSIFTFTGNPSDIENTVIDGGQSGAVLDIRGCDKMTTLSGFTIRNGDNPMGGGVLCYSSDALITDNIIRGNYAGRGGGIYCINSNPTIHDNRISGNSTRTNGAGIYCYHSDPLISSNIILANTTDGEEFEGGGISCFESDPVVKHNIIRENTAGYGGGIHAYDSNLMLSNNTITGNQALYGGAVAFASSTPIVRNVIFRDNKADLGPEIYLYSATNLVITHSNVEGGEDSTFVKPGCELFWGDGMIDTDPLFRDPDSDDFHLMAVACGDSLDSPCIDAGYPGIIDSLLDCSWGLGTNLSDIGTFSGGDSISVGTGDTEPGPRAPAQFSLLQNYPNPFNPSTTISFGLPGIAGFSQNVSLTIYSIRGRMVKMLVDKALTPGNYQIAWDGRDERGDQVPSGIYFYTLRSEERAPYTRKMNLMK